MEPKHRISKSTIVFAVIIVGAVIYAEFFKKDYRLKLKAETHVIVAGKATGISATGHSTPSLVLEFMYNGEDYSARYRTDEIYSEKEFINKFFPVVVSSEDPDSNSVLVTPDDFAFFDQPFPDSLKWVTYYTYKDYPDTRTFRSVNP